MATQAEKKKIFDDVYSNQIRIGTDPKTAMALADEAMAEYEKRWPSPAEPPK